MNNDKNIIVSIPSGEVFNCNKLHKYHLYIKGFVKIEKYYNEMYLNEYVFKDKTKRDVYNYIKSTIKIGMPISHYIYGEGKISGIIDNDWVVWFDNKYFSNKKIYVTTEEMIKNLNFSFND